MMPTHASRTPRRAGGLSDLATQLRLACMRISRRVRVESAGTVAPHHISVLFRLSDQPRTAGELAEIERVSAPSMTRTVKGLVELGLISRTSDPSDGRCVILSLTPEGRRALAASRSARDEWMTARVAQLDPAEQDTLRQALGILQRIAEQ